MSDVLLKKLQKNKFVLIDGEMYKLVGDYSDVQTKLDYEFQHAENNDDTFMVTHNDLAQRLQSQWKVVKLGK